MWTGPTKAVEVFEWTQREFEVTVNVSQPKQSKHVCMRVGWTVLLSHMTQLSKSDKTSWHFIRAFLNIIILISMFLKLSYFLIMASSVSCTTSLQEPYLHCLWLNAPLLHLMLLLSLSILRHLSCGHLLQVEPRVNNGTHSLMQHSDYVRMLTMSEFWLCQNIGKVTDAAKLKYAQEPLLLV